jgi:phospholipase/carboxylesterase
VVLTGGIFGLPEERRFAPHRLDGLRVFLTGSDSDEWIPLEGTQRTARVLTELGAEVQLRIYKGRPHIVSPEELAEARTFITELLLR